MIRAILIVFAVTITSNAARAETKRDIQGVTLGMSPQDVVSASKRSCRIFAPSVAPIVRCFDNGKTETVTAYYTKFILPSRVYGVQFEFCTTAENTEIIDQLSKDYAFTMANIHKNQRNHEVVQLDKSTQLEFGNSDNCPNNKGRTFVVVLTDMKTASEEIDSNPANAGPQKVVPKF